MTKASKIILVIPYFGKWPEYFNIYLKGCENNKWLDILFFTDCPAPIAYPSNVSFIPSSLSAVSALLKTKTGIATSINFAYKLCDLRPLYGKIFEDYIRDYDFWGYGDIDLIYGKLEDFVLPRISAGFDVLSSRNELLSGSLSFFRNTEQINNYYLHKVPDLSVLKSDEYEGIDETGHCHITWSGGSKADLPKYSFTYIVYEAMQTGNLKVSFETICKEIILNKELIKFQEGELELDKNAFGYFHYVCNKSDAFFKFPGWKLVPDNFLITRTGFYTSKEFKNFWMLDFIRFGIGKSTRLLNRFLKRLK